MAREYRITLTILSLDDDERDIEPDAVIEESTIVEVENLGVTTIIGRVVGIRATRVTTREGAHYT